MNTARTVMGLLATGLVLALSVADAPPASAGDAPEPSGSAFDPSRCAALSPEGASGEAPSYGRFGVELLGAVSREGERNALVSPLSVGTVLEMLEQGANERVRRAIREMLRGKGPAGEVDEVSPAAAGAGSADGQAPGAREGRGADSALLCRLAAVSAAAAEDAGVELNIANAAFAAQALALNPTFAAVLRDRFGARAERLNFSRPDSVERINAWVARETADAIPELLREDDVDPATVLVLVNAVYFRGEWAQPFDPARTARLPFHTGAGSHVDVPTLQADDLSAHYRRDESFEALSLPYGDGRFALMLVLPRAGLASSEALRRLASDPSWLSGHGYHRAHGSLSLPRTTLHDGGSLLQDLSALGLGGVLDDRSAFSGIASPPPTLDDVIYQTLLVLDEKGTEAAAATAAILTKSLSVRFEMRVDRPFALALRHLESGAFLFAAWVSDPTG